MEIQKAARLAVRNVEKEGLTDIFPSPFELKLLRNTAFQKVVVKDVTTRLKGGSLDSLCVSMIGHVLLPKTGPFDFRRCALIQPLDTIKYLALTLTMADKLEKHRPPKGKKIVFSYRFDPRKGYLFDPKYSITTFRKYVSKKIREKGTEALVSCDIADFYDRLNLHRLESVLLSLGMDRVLVSQLNQLLLFWADRNSYGLPVGSNASRILAEAALLEVDNYLLSIGVRFCRFVDDYRLFAPNPQVVHRWLTQLIECLWLEGLTINKRKTKIDGVSDLSKEEDEEVRGVPERISSKRKETADSESREPQFRIIAGYGGRIPTRFRVPKKSEIEKLKDGDLAELLESIRSKKQAEAEHITDLIKTVVSKKAFDFLASVLDITDIFPQFTPYVVDVLIKYQKEIAKEPKEVIRNHFSRALKDGQHLSEYLILAIVRLLGSQHYQDKNTLLDYFRGLRRDSGAYVGRALLDSLEDLVSRREVLEIRNYFARADGWERRQIMRIVDKHLEKGEKRPWLKNARTEGSNDLFLREYIKPTKKAK